MVTSLMWNLWRLRSLGSAFQTPMLCVWLWPIHRTLSHFFFLLPANHFKYYQKNCTLAGIFTSKTCYPLAWQTLFLLLCSWGMQPDSWCAVLYPFIPVVFSITTQLSAPPALAQCWQQRWQGRDWTAWLEGLLEVTHWVERGEITLSIQTENTQRQFLTPGPQCKDALVASGTWSGYFTSLLSWRCTLCHGHPWVWVTCWQVFPGLNLSTLLHK